MNAMSGNDEAEAQAERYRALLEINNAVVGKLTRDTLFAAVRAAASPAAGDSRGDCRRDH